MEDLKPFWDRVNTLIKQNKTTQKKLSLTCGFSERRIETLATPKRSPDVLEAVKIAQALNTTVEFLVTGKNSDKDTILLAKIKQLLDDAPIVYNV